MVNEEDYLFIENRAIDLSDKYLDEYRKDLSRYGAYYKPEDNEEKKKFKVYMKEIFKKDRFTYNSFAYKSANLSENINNLHFLNIDIHILQTCNILTVIYRYEYDDIGVTFSYNPSFKVNEDGNKEIDLRENLEEYYRIYNEVFIGQVINPFLERIGEELIVIK